MNRVLAIVFVGLLTGLFATENVNAQLFRARSARSNCDSSNQTYRSGYSGYAQNSAGCYGQGYAASQQMQQSQLQAAQQHGAMRLAYDARTGQMYYVPVQPSQAPTSSGQVGNQGTDGQAPPQSTAANRNVGVQPRAQQPVLPGMVQSNATHAEPASPNNAADAIYSSLNAAGNVQPATFDAPVSENAAPFRLENGADARPTLELPAEETGITIQAPGVEQHIPAGATGSQSVLDFDN